MTTELAAENNDERENWADERNWSVFYSRVVTRAHRLIDTGIWEGIRQDRLEVWLDKIHAYTQRKILAACLLDSLVYRSRDQFNALIRSLFFESARFRDSQAFDDDLVKRLCSATDPSIRIAPVIGLDAPPTKSGPYVLRVAARMFRFRDDWLIWPQNIATHLPESLEHLIFIDDFCGTGKQFTDFLKSHQVDKLHQERPALRISYLVAAAHTEGIKKIAEKYPFVEVFCADRLTNEHNFFSEASFDHYKVPELAQAVWQDYDRAVTDAHIAGRVANSAGFGKLGISYAFYHSTPNNTLPIFWKNSDRWAPLLDR